MDPSSVASCHSVDVEDRAGPMSLLVVLITSSSCVLVDQSNSAADIIPQEFKFCGGIAASSLPESFVNPKF